jgi:DNA-binding Lrp family transcriptional regulator
MDLDRTDVAILDALQKNARLSNKELAAKVDLAPSSCLQRVRRLLEAGVLRGFHADVDPAAIGVGIEAMVMVRLSRHSRETVEAFREHVLSLPRVVTAYHVSGSHDFLVLVAVRDAHHLRDFVLDAFTSRREVARIETALVFEQTRAPSLPLEVEEKAGRPKKRRRGTLRI